jgi:hypothetical protein
MAIRGLFWDDILGSVALVAAQTRFQPASSPSFEVSFSARGKFFRESRSEPDRWAGTGIREVECLQQHSEDEAAPNFSSMTKAVLG